MGITGLRGWGITGSRFTFEGELCVLSSSLLFTRFEVNEEEEGSSKLSVQVIEVSRKK